MIVADDRYAVGSRGPGNGNRPVEVQAAVKIGPGKRNRVGVLRRDDIRARGESLRHRNVSNAKRRTNNKMAESHDLLARSIAPGETVRHRVVISDCKSARLTSHRYLR